jgi:hypothetical protein
MQRTLIRLISVGALIGALVAVSAGSAFASHGHARFGARFGQDGNGGPGGNLFGFGGPGGPGGFGRGFGGPGGPGGGGGVLNADVITAAAGCLSNMSVSALTSDLAGGKTLAQEATAKGSSASALITCLVAAQTKVYDNEKAAGWITSDQETALVKGYTDAVTDLVNNGPPVPPGGQNGGHEGPLQLAADYLGVSVSDLMKDFQSGEDLADVVGNVNGKTVDGLVQAMLAPAKTKLDAAVTAGTITSAQETAILNKLTTNLTNFINTKRGTHMSSTTTQMSRLFMKYTNLHRYNRRLK